MSNEFVDNIAAGVEVLGVEYAPIILPLAQIRWASPQERDQFLQMIGGGSGNA